MQTFGRYEITRELGRGGMASVFEANDPRFGRPVAVKVLPREMLFDPAFRARFDREARTVAMLEHSGIVPVHDYGEQDGQPFIVMRFMPGGSLADRLKNGPLPIRKVAEIFNRIGAAIDYAHAQGVVHRDLKPANILFDNAGEAYIADFGIAKLSENAATMGLTQGVIGTPAYMSPEQWEGKTIDGRSDLYALGIILFESLAGRLPYVADSMTGFMKAHLFDPVPAIPNTPSSFAAPLQSVIQRVLAKSADQRYPTAAFLAADLQAIADGRMVAPETQVLRPGFGGIPASGAPSDANLHTGPQAIVPPESVRPANAGWAGMGQASPQAHGSQPGNAPGYGSQPGQVPVPGYQTPGAGFQAGPVPAHQTPGAGFQTGPVAGPYPVPPPKSKAGLIVAIGGGAIALIAIICACVFLLPAINAGLQAASATSTPVRPTAVVARATDTPVVRVTPGTATVAPGPSATVALTRTAIPPRTATPSGTRAPTAVATLRPTVVAVPAAPPINLASRDAVAIGKALEALKTTDKLVLEPVTGGLAHQPGAKKVTWLRPDLWVEDFVAEVDFGNPYGATEGPWDYGIFFRIDDDVKSHYRFIIKSTGAWELRLVLDDDANSPVTASGTLTNLGTGRGMVNKLTLYAFGDRGSFWVNGLWSGAIWDLSGRTDGGDVAIVTGMFDEDHKAGAITKYTGFRVYDLAQ